MAFNINGKLEERTLLQYVPHGIDSVCFKPLTKEDSKLIEFKKRLFGNRTYKFIILYNSRNVNRKRTSNIMLAYKTFCENLSKEESEQCVLVLHTEIMCDAGTNLIALKEAFCPDNNIIFSPQKLSPDDMCFMYNTADVTVNGSCIPPGYKITTFQGEKNIEEIKIGEMVFTHKGRFKKVIKTFQYDNVDCEMIKITPFNLNDSLELTSEHKVFAVKKSKLTNKLLNENQSLQQYMEWIPAGELSPGDLVMYPKLTENIYKNIKLDLKDYFVNHKYKKYQYNDTEIYLNHSKNKINRFIDLDEDLCYLLGRWCGDGSNNTICFDEKYGTEEIQKLGVIFKSKFEGSYNIYHHNDKNKKCIILSFKHPFMSIILNLFKTLCGNNSFNKHIPNEVFYNENIQLLNAFINGLIDSDGYEGKMNQSSYTKITTVSNQLKQQLIFSLIRLNKKVRLGIGKSGYKPGNQHHQIYFTHTDEDNASSRSWFKDGYYFMSINKVEKYLYTGKVYNIEVEEDNSYISSCITVHNSNEGFGLSIAESLMCGTPVVVAVTGGLQDQIGQVDDNGNPIKFKLDFGSNNIGRYKKHGKWAYAIWPVTRMVQGSIPTPYIFDDLTKWEDFAEGFMYWYLMDENKREECGLAGRNWCLGDGGLNSQHMGQQFIDGMEFIFNKWGPPKKFGVYSIKDYVGNIMPGSMGFPIPTIDKEQIKNKINSQNDSN